VKRKLVIKAQADLDEVGHYVYLLGRNPLAAERFNQAVKAAHKRIGKDPRGCATLSLPEYAHLELRFCRPTGFDNYLIIFQVTDEGPVVLRVLHSAQDVVQALRGKI
jgi:plasmid stabilization system protein ParE